MKKNIIWIILLLLGMLLAGCKSGGPFLTISLPGDAEVGKNVPVEVKLNGNILEKDKYLLSVADEKIAIMRGGMLYGIKSGETILNAVYVENPKINASLKVKIKIPSVREISIDGKTEAVIGSTFKLTAETVPFISGKKIKWESSNPDVLTVDKEGTVNAVKVGTATVYARCDDVFDEIEITITPKPEKIIFFGKNEICVKEVAKYKFNVPGVKLSSSNPDIAKVAGRYVTGLKEGTVTLTAKAGEIEGTFELKVIGEKDRAENKMTPAEKEQIDAVMQNLSLKEKIGQMFCLGVSGAIYRDYRTGLLIYEERDDETGLPWLGKEKTTLDEYLQKYPIANFSVTDFNAQDSLALLKTSKAVRESCGKINSIDPLVLLSYDYMYYQDVILKKPTNQALGKDASKLENIVKITESWAEGLKYFGINGVINNYLDKTDLENNDVYINSLAENEYRLCNFSPVLDDAENMANLMRAICDSEDLVFIPSTGYNKDNLISNDYAEYDLELLKRAIKSGSDLINITNQSCASLSEPCDNTEEGIPAGLYESHIKYVRNDLNYQGVLLLDSRGLVKMYFNSFSQEDTCRELVDSINAGLDMIEINSVVTPLEEDSIYYTGMFGINQVSDVFDYVVAAAESGAILPERIDEAVKRILLMKIRHGIINPKEKEINIDDVRRKINEEAPFFISFEGDKCLLDYDDSALFISEGYNRMSKTRKTAAECFEEFFNDKGYHNFNRYNLTNLNTDKVYADAKTAGRVYVCVSRYYLDNPVRTIGYGDKASFFVFLSELVMINPNVCVIFLDEPSPSYDMRLRVFEGNLIIIKNFVYTHGYYDSSFENIFRAIGGINSSAK